jgi:hypothetical protein
MTAVDGVAPPPWFADVAASPTAVLAEGAAGLEGRHSEQA